MTGSFFALSVPDIEVSTRWYAEKLGLSVVMQVPRTDNYAVAILEGGGLTVELIQLDDAVPLTEPASAIENRALVHGITKVGFIVEDLEGTLRQLRARGVEIAMGPFPARENQRSNAIIRDNDGNLIQLFGR